MKRATLIVFVLTCLGTVATDGQSCSSISGSNSVSGGYQCVGTDPPFQHAETDWSATATCYVRDCSGPLPSSPYDYPSGTLTGFGNCGTYNTATSSQIPGAVNCYATLSIPGTSNPSTNNDSGGLNIYTLSEMDQTQSSDVQHCLNGGSVTSQIQVECSYENCPTCSDGGYCSANSDCASGCCDVPTNECVTSDNCSTGGGGECKDNGDTCSTDGECCSNHCDEVCDDVDPIIVDLGGRGYELTNIKDGVIFDFFGGGSSIQMSWTAAGWNGGFLVLDRNGNGRIDDGAELFSNIAPQPSKPGRGKNGFAALAVYDLKANGGNEDGWIDGHDSIYSKLFIWIDVGTTMAFQNPKSC